MIQFFQAPISKKQVAHATRLPNFLRFVWKSSKRQRAAPASYCGTHERPANKLASRALLNGSGGSRRILDHAFAGKSDEAEITEIGNKKVAATHSGTNLVILTHKKFWQTLVSGRAEIRRIFMRFDYVVGAEWRVINILLVQFVSTLATVEGCGHFQEGFNFVFHLNSPTPDAPRRGLNFMLIKELYHSMGDNATTKSIYCDYFKKTHEYNSIGAA